MATDGCRAAQVTDHARQLLEKYWRQPFFSAANVRYATGHGRRMEWDRVEEGLEWLDECFHLIRYEDEELPNIDWVLDLARAAVLRCVAWACPAAMPRCGGLP